MNVMGLAEILRTGFDGFKGSPEGLYSLLASRRDFCSMLDVPGNAHSLVTAVRSVAPDMRQYGVAITVFPTGKIHILALAAAQQEETEMAAFGAEFNGDPHLKAEFGTIERYAAFKTAEGAGQINLRRARNIVDAEDRGTHAQVDPRLTIEARCRDRWAIEPETRKSFGQSYQRFEAFEKAHAEGRVRKYAGASF
jgi:hypothetical protein